VCHGASNFKEHSDEQRQQGIEEAQADDAGQDSARRQRHAHAGKGVATTAAQEVADDVTKPATGASLPAPFFHQDSEALRFWVQVPGGGVIGAMLTRQLLHYRFDANPDGSNAVALYEKHRAELDAAVLARVANGSIEPVMLREHDLPQRPRR
jgi:hypothetical protein